MTVADALEWGAQCAPYLAAAAAAGGGAWGWTARRRVRRGRAAQALLQNQSLLATCAADFDEAAFVARRWNGHVTPETITDLPKYHYVMSLNLDGRRTTPFRVRGLPVEEIYAHYDNPDGIPDLDQAIDSNLNRRTVGDILAALEDLDGAVLSHHLGLPSAPADNTDPTTALD